MAFVNNVYRSSSFGNEGRRTEDRRKKTIPSEPSSVFIPPHCVLCLLYLWPMPTDDNLIDKLSRLAMLDFDATEREELKADLERLIGFVDKLKELDTTGVEPLLHITNEVNVLRDDVPANMLTKEQALQNAPLHNDDFFLVPKVIKKD